MVENPRRYDYYIKVHQEAIFGDYGELIIQATTYEEIRPQRVFDYWRYDIEESLSAVDELCKIKTQTSTNLLHHLRKMKDVQVDIQRVETHYAKDDLSGQTTSKGTLSFEPLRDKAIIELNERGNPGYDFSIYKSEDCWQII